MRLSEIIVTIEEQNQGQMNWICYVFGDELVSAFAYHWLYNVILKEILEFVLSHLIEQFHLYRKPLKVWETSICIMLLVHTNIPLLWGRNIYCVSSELRNHRKYKEKTTFGRYGSLCQGWLSRCNCYPGIFGLCVHWFIFKERDLHLDEVVSY